MAQTHSIDLEFSSNQYLSIADASQTGLDLTTALTIELWIKAESLNTPLASFIGKYGSAGNRSYYFYYDVDSPRLGINLSGNGTAVEGEISSTWQPVIGRWYHLAVTYDGSAGEVKFYVDGKQLGTTQTTSVSSLFNSSAAFVVGALDTTPSFEWDGLIKDLRVFNDVRSEAEIAADAGTESVSDANLVAEWNFNNAYTDASGNGNTLSAAGSPVFSTDIAWEDANQIDGSTYLETNLVSFFNFDDVLTDAHGANDLTHSGSPTYSSGIINNGLDLERSSSESASITDASQSGLDITGDLSISAWINLESAPASNETYTIASKWGNVGAQTSYTFNYFNNAGTPRLQLRVSSGSPETLFVNHTLSTSTLHHVVATFDASLSLVSFYVDGIFIGSTTGTTTSITNGNEDFVVGGQADGIRYFDGIIDELAVYDRVLHYGDIIDLYNAGNGISYTAPVGAVFTPLVRMF